MTAEIDEGASERSSAIRALELEFGTLFAQMRRMYAELADRFSPGMLPSTYKMFSVIAHHGPVTASALGERLMLDKGQVSRTVRELDELGLIERAPDPNDRRSSLITATSEGSARFESARHPTHRRLEDGLTSWDVKDIWALADLLHALAAGEEPGASRAGRPAADKE